MAKIQIVADTELKTLACSINGTLIPDIEDANVYTYRDSNGNITSMDVNLRASIKTAEDVEIRVTYYAYGSVKAQSALASGQKVYNNVTGFVGVADRTQAIQDINEFLSSKK